MMDEIKLILPTSWTPNLDEFLAALKISPDGLGSQLFENVFDALFVSSVELKKEFRKYYSVEYSTLSDYADIRYGLVLEGDDLDSDYIFLVRWLPETVDTIYDDSKLSTVLECIAKLEEAQRENQA